MKLKSIGVCLPVLLLAVSCGKQGDKAASEVNDEGIPVSVADIMMGDSCKIDTLYVDEDRIYMYAENNDYMQRLIFDRNGLIVNNPVLTVDSLTATSYRIGDLINSVVVDFAIEENVETLRGTFPVYDDYPTVTYTHTQAKPVSTLFALAASVPDGKVPHASDISRWVASAMDSIPFDGSFKTFGEGMAKEMNESVGDLPMSFTLSETYSSLAYYRTKDYVTYFNAYYSFLGGAHGMYGYSFGTYLTEAGRPLTVDYMFKAESANDIRNLIYEGFLTKTDFTSNHNINSVSQVKSYIDSNLMGDLLPIPAPGLLPQGVVFCYQPYEVGAYADGSFQIVVPYDKLRPYMTDAGRRLIP